MSFINAQLIESTFTRPSGTTAYEVGDVVGTEATANHTFTISEHITNENIGKVIYIVGATLRIDADAIPGGMTAGFQLHLFNKAPTVQVDNAALALEKTKPYLKTILAFPLPVDKGSFLWSELQDIRVAFPFLTTEVTLIGNLVSLSAYTPTASTPITISLILSKT